MSDDTKPKTDAITPQQFALVLAGVGAQLLQHSLIYANPDAACDPPGAATAHALAQLCVFCREIGLPIPERLEAKYSHLAAVTRVEASKNFRRALDERGEIQ